LFFKFSSNTSEVFSNIRFASDTLKTDEYFFKDNKLTGVRIGAIKYRKHDERTEIMQIRIHPD
jgi:hypothetical protein